MSEPRFHPSQVIIPSIGRIVIVHYPHGDRPGIVISSPSKDRMVLADADSEETRIEVGVMGVDYQFQRLLYGTSFDAEGARGSCLRWSWPVPIPPPLMPDPDLNRLNEVR